MEVNLRTEPCRIEREDFPYCWMISVLQAFCNIDWPVDFFKYSKMNKDTFSIIFKQIFHMKYNVGNDLIILSNIEETVKTFISYANNYRENFETNETWDETKQQDVSEVIQYILSMIVDVQNPDYISPGFTKQDKNIKTIRKIQSFIKQNIIFKTLTEIICLDKKKKHPVRSEALFSLKLIIPGDGKSTTVQELIAHNMNATNTDDDYECKYCKSRHSVKTKTQFTSVGEYILVELKRYKSDHVFQRKIQTQVDLRQNITIMIKQRQLTFSCVAAINHDSDIIQFGHYTTDKLLHRKLFHCDDENVKETDHWNTMDSYFLIYKKVKNVAYVNIQQTELKINVNEHFKEPPRKKQKINFAEIPKKQLQKSLKSKTILFYKKQAAKQGIEKMYNKMTLRAMSLTELLTIINAWKVRIKSSKKEIIIQQIYNHKYNQPWFIAYHTEHSSVKNNPKKKQKIGLFLARDTTFPSVISEIETLKIDKLHISTDPKLYQPPPVHSSDKVRLQHLMRLSKKSKEAQAKVNKKKYNKTYFREMSGVEKQNKVSKNKKIRTQTKAKENKKKYNKTYFCEMSGVKKQNKVSKKKKGRKQIKAKVNKKKYNKTYFREMSGVKKQNKVSKNKKVRNQIKTKLKKRKYDSKKFEKEKKRREKHPKTFKRAYISNGDIENINNNFDKIPYYNVGSKTIICKFCQADMWKGESTSRNVFSLCCCGGAIGKLGLPDIPNLIKELFERKHPMSEIFYNNIRAINQGLAMASIDTDSQLIWERNAPMTFKIHGHLYHHVDTVTPRNAENKNNYTFGQIYLLDPADQIEVRAKHLGLNDSKVKDLIEILQNFLLKENILIQQFKSCYERAKTMPHIDEYKIILSDEVPKGQNPKLYEKPTANNDNLAVLVTNPDEEKRAPRGIIMQSRKPVEKDKLYTRVTENFGYYDSLCYPLFFPKPMFTWKHKTLKRKHSSPKRKFISAREYYSYMLQTRKKRFNPFLQGERLFQQYILDMFCKIQQFELTWIKNNQGKIRSDLYSGVVDAMQTDNLRNIGKKKIIVPGSVTTSPRWYHVRYQNALAVAYKLGLPSLFITFTCNDEWPEIREALDGKQAKNRSEVVTRVFHMKLQELLRELKKDQIFGKVVGRMHTVEFQKRGRPHAHILVILAKKDRLHTTDDFDKIVSAEIPDPKKFPKLHEKVLRHMVHSPCSYNIRKTKQKNCVDPQTQKCKKYFPFDNCDYTKINEAGVVYYKRRKIMDDRGSETEQKKIIDNSWVVPYNPYLLAKYDAHINVIIPNTANSIKYLYKYVYKGTDKAAFYFKAAKDKFPKNEIKRLIDARYIAACEACWRIFSFPLHGLIPSVTKLQLHLENLQHVDFESEQKSEEYEKTLQKISKTSLTEWFEFNKKHGHEKLPAKMKTFVCSINNEHILKKQKKYEDLRYEDAVLYCTWNKTKKQWLKKTNRRFGIARTTNANFGEGERFHLSTLLRHVPGPTGFKDLKKIKNTVCKTFKEACVKRGLYKNPEECFKCLEDAIQFDCQGSSLRHLFATLLIYYDPDDGDAMWRKFRDHLTDDIRRQKNPHGNFTEEMYDEALEEISEFLKQKKKTLQEYNLPKLKFVHRLTKVLRRELKYNAEKSKIYVQNKLKSLNKLQKCFYNLIMSFIYADEFKKPAMKKFKNIMHPVFFLQALGGGGKTWLLNLVINTIHAHSNICLSTAYSGIAALLLKLGQTMHSKLKVPFEITKQYTLNVTKDSALAHVIRQAKIIIIDECPMARKEHMQAVDKGLRDICEETKPFGGKVILMAGDFRQLLSVIPGASEIELINSTIHKSKLWQYVTLLELKQNERVNQLKKKKGNKCEVLKLENFAKLLKQIGDGTYPVEEQLGSDTIKLPVDWVSDSETLNEFITEIFPDIQTGDINNYSKRAILTTTNEYVNIINQHIMDLMPGDKTECLPSIDELMPQNRNALYTEKMLNSLNPSGSPPSNLFIKKNAIIMLLRNINQDIGACNGTRLKVVDFTTHCIDGIIITGPRKGEHVLIPKIKNILDKDPHFIPFIRYQFPVKPAFAMTINKSQGQTLEKVGLYLPHPVFTHGQLYVACGRVGSPDHLAIFVENRSSQGTFEIDGSIDTYTRNVVFKNALLETNNCNYSKETSDEQKIKYVPNEYICACGQLLQYVKKTENNRCEHTLCDKCSDLLKLEHMLYTCQNLIHENVINLCIHCIETWFADDTEDEEKCPNIETSENVENTTECICGAELVHTMQRNRRRKLYKQYACAVCDSKIKNNDKIYLCSAVTSTHPSEFNVCSKCIKNESWKNKYLQFSKYILLTDNVAQQDLDMNMTDDYFEKEFDNSDCDIEDTTYESSYETERKDESEIDEDSDIGETVEEFETDDADESETDEDSDIAVTGVEFETDQNESETDEDSDIAVTGVEFETDQNDHSSDQEVIDEMISEYHMDVITDINSTSDNNDAMDVDECDIPNITEY